MPTNDVTLDLGNAYIGSAYSPTVEVTDIEGGHKVAITSADPEQAGQIVTQDFAVYDGAGADEYRELADEVAEAVDELNEKLGDIPTIVDEWLDDHPEATTTVQDGAVTIDKLHVSSKEGLYYDDGVSDAQAYPLSVGSVTYRGVTVTVEPNGIVRVKGTATDNARFRLTGGLAYSNSAANLYQTDNELETGWYVINTKLMGGTYSCDTTGDRGGIYFFFDNGSGSWPTSAQQRVYGYDHGWRLSYSTNVYAKVYPLAFVLLFVKSGESYDCKLRIDIRKVGVEDRARQADIARMGPYSQRSVKTAQFWVRGMVNDEETDGLRGNAKRMAFEYPVTFETDVRLAISDPTYMVAVQAYSDPGDIQHGYLYLDWSSSSEPRTIPAGTCVRILLRKASNADFTADECDDAIKKVVLDEVSTTGLSIASRNPDAVNNLSVMARGAGTVIVAHITDTHSDAIRWNNFVRACEELQPDVVIHTGDIVKVDMRDDYRYLTEHLPSIPTILSMGNHEIGAGHGTAAGGIDTATVVSTWVTPVNEKYGWEHEHPYYYYDVDPVRFVNLYMYDYDEGDGGTFVDRSGIYYTQDQIDWLVATLKDAKDNNLAVVIVAHEPDKVMPFEDGFGKFNNAFNPTSSSYKRTEDSPICDIIETFIAGGTISQNYVQANTHAPSAPSITVDETFEAGGKFVCWLTGHLHGDVFGWLPDTHQLLIRLAAGCLGISQTYSTLNNKDLGQRIGTKTEDCFNFYAIKPGAHTIGLVRFGADTTTSFAKRDYMVQDYVRS